MEILGAVILVMVDLVLLVGLIMVVVHTMVEWRNRVPLVLTPREVVGQIMEALDLPEGGVFYELGCGEGRLLRAVRERKEGVRLVGVDNDPVVLLMAWLRLRGRAQLLRRDVHEVELERADRVFVYLGARLMGELEEKFARELKPGARLVSLQFPLPGRRPSREVRLDGGKDYAERLYVYDY